MTEWHEKPCSGSSNGTGVCLAKRKALGDLERVIQITKRRMNITARGKRSFFPKGPPIVAG